MNTVNIRSFGQKTLSQWLGKMFATHKLVCGIIYNTHVQVTKGKERLHLGTKGLHQGHIKVVYGNDP